MKRIGFIGAGKVGHVLGGYLAQHGFTLQGYVSRTLLSAKKAASAWNTKVYCDKKELVKDCDWLLLTVPDDKISSVYLEIAPFLTLGHVVFHCSGALTSEIFTPKIAGVHYYSFHPMLAIGNTHSFQSLSQAAFTLEGLDVANILPELSCLKNPIHTLASKEKVRYHAGCVFLSNLVIALAQTGTTLLKDCGLPESFVFGASHTLLQQNINQLASVGATKALTGPIERNDVQTVTRHLEVLNDQQSLLYCLLSRELLTLAQIKHPETDYSTMERILNS
ncbi:DUF2520 domain-containing protein [Enterococcus asini]|uniref:Rossmann-like and DUF2520 domain-containing protein n=1 Tax=Enterococcus asini TaxID=57732 RepID=UPI00289225D8|nr:Rossmann-like and DUF2520 domain-containing protein [Enterococcus asini]MDT2757874.1 DUF2520 domain-containing protein [Enterococcus asini]